MTLLDIDLHELDQGVISRIQDYGTAISDSIKPRFASWFDITRRTPKPPSFEDATRNTELDASRINDLRQIGENVSYFNSWTELLKFQIDSTSYAEMFVTALDNINNLMEIDRYDGLLLLDERFPRNPIQTRYVQATIEIVEAKLRVRDDPELAWIE